MTDYRDLSTYFSDARHARGLTRIQARLNRMLENLELAQRFITPFEFMAGTAAEPPNESTPTP